MIDFVSIQLISRFNRIPGNQELRRVTANDKTAHINVRHTLTL